MAMNPNAPQNPQPGFMQGFPVPVQTDGLIGRPMHFTAGQFAGKTIRAEIFEIQKADFGRKFASMDRRPIDPPPVIFLRLFEVFNFATPVEFEVELDSYESIDVLGLMCSAEIFSADDVLESGNHTSQYGPIITDDSLPPLPTPLTWPTASGSQELDMTHQLGSVAITTDSDFNTKPLLFGSTVVQAVKVNYAGRIVLLFPFTDLSVKKVGTFIPRYRFFNTFFPPQGHIDAQVQAECFGGPFRIYPTNATPSLSPSTGLTKMLAEQGVKIHVRNKIHTIQKRCRTA